MAIARVPAGFAAALAGVALIAGAVAVGPSAGAAATAEENPSPDPRLLMKAHLPDKPLYRGWVATPGAGLEEQFLCEEEPLPLGDTQYRIFYDEKAGHAITQYVVAMATPAEAHDTALKIRKCFAQKQVLADSVPRDDDKFSFQDYGPFEVDDELMVGAVTKAGKRGDDVTRWAIGRDDEKLTLLVFPTVDSTNVATADWIALADQALRRVVFERPDSAPAPV